MEWVFDTSVTMAWCFDDERTDATDALFDKLIARRAAAVPQIWPLEVANVLVQAERKRRISTSQRRQFLALLESAEVHLDVPPLTAVFNAVLPLAEKYRLTTYDASYLELAMRLGVPLATLDKDLRTAAASAGVVLL